MFAKMLIANRGEIAVRIIRTCKEMGIATVAVYSEADKDAMHVRMADQAVCIGPARSSESYLSFAKIIEAGLKNKVDAVHPGYGFLSEDPFFAKMCKAAKITFVGPRWNVIEKMGDKAQARATAREAGVPVVPGSDGEIEANPDTIGIAAKIGYPLLVKPSAGGGGKGMRIVRKKSALLADIQSSQNEAKALFGNGGVYLERFLENARHIEVQVAVDRFGNAIHLGERDCSIQRRHQKLIEESPSPALKKRMRSRICNDAVRMAQAVGYTNVGTVEFVLDSKGKYYFMEMNTRIQVEHPVTELVTGVDLVKLQIQIASGEELPFYQKDIRPSGHAIECRINAEDPANDFAPAPGKVTEYQVPGGPGVRVDSHVHRQYDIPHFYDSMIAKLIVHAEDREIAIRRMQRSLEEYRIDGVTTTIPFHLDVLGEKQFRAGDYNTGFVEKNITDPGFFKRIMKAIT